MKIFAIAEAALLATVAYAAPASVEDCTFGVVCTFYSAPDVSFRQCFPTDGSVQRISIFAPLFGSSPPTHCILTFELQMTPLVCPISSVKVPLVLSTAVMAASLLFWD